jgi:DNA-binding ferritin-like protein (Dps family)
MNYKLKTLHQSTELLYEAYQEELVEVDEFLYQMAVLAVQGSYEVSVEVLDRVQTAAVHEKEAVVVAVVVVLKQIHLSA